MLCRRHSGVGRRQGLAELKLGRLAVDQVVSSLKAIGLTVAPLKTEMLFMNNRARGELSRARIRIDNVFVMAGPTLKYLGLVLDGKWGFQKHFELLTPKLGRVANVLGGFLPNLGSPKRRARRLYIGVVHSMALYGAPVWASAMATNQRLISLAHRIHRWSIHLEGATSRSGTRVSEAIRPCLKEWVNRARGELSFRTTQILTGHGCFGEYLHRIGRELTFRYHHCGDKVDSAQHTLEECSS
ncbi:uncharacterized protein LOC116844970 [Odontomachus brunneus]|uniref:uncharacterized protein LOC116844970 n=1 Tax=Odontomachus brunneus TaxID=486640 RepID=UPI0013F21951|nr:uncharacterized protein LOC116844970 [Odontomachus brunneus]